MSVCTFIGSTINAQLSIYVEPMGKHTIVVLGGLLVEVVMAHRQIGQVARIVQLRYQTQPHGQLVAAIVVLVLQFVA